MAGRNTAAFGIFRDREGAENAVERLRTGGFRSTDISVLFPDNRGTKDFAVEKSTKAPEGATTGAGSGAVVGGVLGWLAGIGALAIPGLGPLIAAGPIVAALAGVGAGGAIGALSGALIGMGIPEYEAKRYEGRVKSGGILLSVHCDDADWTKKAKKVLEDAGAEDISSTGEAAADYDKSDRPLPRSRTESVGAADLRNKPRPVMESAVPTESRLSSSEPVTHVAYGTDAVATAPLVGSDAAYYRPPSDREDRIASTRASDQDHSLSVLEKLAETCRDGENGFSHAADHVRDPELARFFRERAVERSSFARDLETLIRPLGGSEPSRSGTVGGALHRTWLDVKDKFGAGDQGILESVEQAEDTAKAAYRDALNQHLPEDLKIVVRRQAEAVFASHDRVRLLRDNRRAA